MKYLLLLIAIIIGTVWLIGNSVNSVQKEENVSTSVTPIKNGVSTPVEGKAGSQIISVYFVALDDNGVSGPKIGCGDSIVPIKRDIPKTKEVLKAAISNLLAMKEQYFGESGYYNALASSSLVLESLQVSGANANIYLTGNLTLGGVCDGPRVEEQLKATALQFRSITTVNFFINNQPLKNVLSGK